MPDPTGGLWRQAEHRHLLDRDLVHTHVLEGEECVHLLPGKDLCNLNGNLDHNDRFGPHPPKVRICTICCWGIVLAWISKICSEQERIGGSHKRSMSGPESCHRASEGVL